MSEKTTNATPEKLVTIVTAVERDGFDLRLMTVLFEVPNKDFDLLQAITKAVGEYVKTKEGRETYNNNCGYFNLADVVNSLPASFMEAQGFRMIDAGLTDMEIDWDHEFGPGSDAFDDEDEEEEN